MTKEIRVRFAPSPTGYLHVGSARTALFNYFFARHYGGKFILRIEDTDQKRFQKESLNEIYRSLKWLGLSWDEGPDLTGEFGPYSQSERKELYHKYAQQLMVEEKAYYCFCTPERLLELREKQKKDKAAHISGYDQHCRHLSKGEVKNLLSQGKSQVIRLKIPSNRLIVFNDLIRGNIEYNSDLLDDIVLIKSDGFPTYHLANVIDDHLMRISHVLRGDEWISSTPRHVLLYEAFNWEPPYFAHLPVILSSDGGKLSKRKGAASVMDYKKDGFLPETLVNFLSLLGWSAGDDREIMSKEEIIASFDVKRIIPKAAVFDETKLAWMNGHYLSQRSVGSIIEDVINIWKEMGIVNKKCDSGDIYFSTVIGLLKDRSRKLTDLAKNASYFFVEPVSYDEKAANKYFKADGLKILKKILKLIEPLESWEKNSLENTYRKLSETEIISAGKLIHPTRLAVSGTTAGPGIFEILETLGKERVIVRLKKAINWLEAKRST